MLCSENPLNLKPLRRTPPPFQQTFETPLKALESFVGIIVSAGRVDGGSFFIDKEVFEPVNLTKCLRRYSISSDRRHCTLIATSRSEAEALLQAALSDWLDFVFIPEPHSFLIYADHDEYTTFFAHRRSNLNRVARALLEGGFAAVQYTRQSLSK